MKTLGVNDKFNIPNYSHSDPVNNTIRKDENHPSVKKMSKTITLTFHFPGADKADVEESIGNLNSSKVGSFKNILTKCLTVTSDICSPFLAIIWNQEVILNKNFPQNLKLADPASVYKKGDSTKVKTQTYLCFTYNIKDLQTIDAETNVVRCAIW